MCGVAGYVDYSRAVEPAVLQRMGDLLVHRGPDEGNQWIEGPCGLVHRRLSIVDLGGSHQPMESTGACLAYNGELYNFRELRFALETDGVSFDSNGDTEVLLEHVRRHGPDGLADLDGMFAFGLWDSAQRALLLARDAVGIKPMFYANPRDGLLVFGSEIKAVLAHPEVGCEIDEGSLRQALRFRAVYGERTLYKDVKQLSPGTYLHVSPAGITEGRYYDLAEQRLGAARAQQGVADAELERTGRDLFRAAVEKRLLADVPVGAFLSGGLDSSLVVAMMRELRGPGSGLRTYSVGFRGDESNEQPFGRLVADEFDAQHTEVHIVESDYVELFGQMTQHRDAPISEPADLAIAHMSRVAREDVKVVLTGEGADEAFCGYPKYSLARAPWALRSALRVMGPGVASALGGLARLDKRRLAVAVRALSQPREVDRLVQWFSYLERDTLRGLLPGLRWDAQDWADTTAFHSKVLDGFGDVGPVVRMQALDCLGWLPGNLLERGDRMTMAASLEARVPFLDKAVLAYGLALPDRLKLAGKVGKVVVRRWARGLVPDPILDRRKWGFRVPLADWFRGGMKSMLHDYLNAPNGLVGTYGDANEVRRLLAEHESAKVDHNLALWTLLSLELWYQTVFQRQRTPEKP